MHGWNLLNDLPDGTQEEVFKFIRASVAFRLWSCTFGRVYNVPYRMSASSGVYHSASFGATMQSPVLERLTVIIHHLLSRNTKSNKFSSLTAQSSPLTPKCFESVCYEKRHLGQCDKMRTIQHAKKQEEDLPLEKALGHPAPKHLGQRLEVHPSFK